MGSGFKGSGVECKDNRFLADLLCAVILSSLVIPGTVTHAGISKPFRSVPVPKNNPQTPEKIELGKKLFFDRRLSGDGTTSCADCHIPEQAYTDGQDISLNYQQQKTGGCPDTHKCRFFIKTCSTTAGKDP